MSARYIINPSKNKFKNYTLSKTIISAFTFGIASPLPQPYPVVFGLVFGAIFGHEAEITGSCIFSPPQVGLSVLQTESVLCFQRDLGPRGLRGVSRSPRYNVKDVCSLCCHRESDGRDSLNIGQVENSCMALYFHFSGLHDTLVKRAPV
jgi:hypothetical protein